MRNFGFHAIAGDGSHADTLREAGVSRAEAVLVTVPDSFEARRIVATVQEANPDVRILVQAQNDDDLEFFKNKRVDLAVTGTQEVGRRMVEYLESQLK